MKSNSYTILVVDDEETMRRSLADILRLEGYRVQTAAGGETAIELIHKDVFDLILLDLKMPGVDGLDVLHEANRIAPDTIIILLTAHGSLESAIESLRSGASDYLLKPAPTQAILKSVAKGLERRAEQLRKHDLLNQLANSIQELQNVEVSEPGHSSEPDILLITGEAPENAVQIDLARREIWNQRQKINLTPTEGKLMKVLLENPKRVFTHRELVLKVQGYETTDWEAPEVLRPLVSRLRRKLAKFPGGKDWITSIRATGYVFDPGKK